MLWLWCKLAAAAPIQPLAWEPPHAVGAALKKGQKKKEKCIEIGMKMRSLKYHLLKVGVEVPTLVQLIKDLALLGCGVGCTCGSNSVPGLGTFTCCWCGRKRKKEKK